MSEMLTVVIDRAHWDVPENRRDNTCALLRFVKEHRLQCCLGVVGTERGIDDAKLLDVGSPDWIGPAGGKFPKTIVRKTTVIEHCRYHLYARTNVCNDLMAANDDVAMGPTEREAAIQRYGLNANIRFEFTGEYLKEPLG